MPISHVMRTVVQNEFFDMKQEPNKSQEIDYVYRSGRRTKQKQDIKPSKLKIGALGLDAIVKPNK